MKLLGKLNRTSSDELPDFDPQTTLREWGDGRVFRISDALTGVCVFGATGSGKTSGAARHLAIGYLAAGFGGLVLCAKTEEADQWRDWAQIAGRSDDLVVFNPRSKLSFNFLEWESRRAGAGGGQTINIVALLDEVAGALAGDSGGGGGSGNSQFFKDALHHMNMNLVDLVRFADLPITLEALRDIVISAPMSAKDVESEQWKTTSRCAQLIRMAHVRLKQESEDQLLDFRECYNYWLLEFPTLAETTRSIIVLTFSMLARPFLTQPLRRLFSSPVTNVMPEDCFDDGKIIVVDLPVQEHRLAGRLANLAWKYCFQIAVLRRARVDKGRHLRPVFLWADEAQNFVSAFDPEYQAVARSAGGCTVYLTQNREGYRRVLGDDDAVDSLLGNLQAKFFCQNGSVDTNEWASKLLGQRWVEVSMRSGGATGTGIGGTQGKVTATAGFSTQFQQRHYVQPTEFATLRRGGRHNDSLVDCFVYNGGQLYASDTDEDGVPYTFLTFNQNDE